MTPRATTTRRTRSDGRRSREAILAVAERLAAVEGLDGLSLSRLAAESGMSKSGVFGLFGSKEELQFAIVDRARETFVAEVVSPALAATSGRRRLLALCEAYLDYVGRREWPVGCFFASVAAELGPRPGPLRDRIAADQIEWVGLLADAARQPTAGRRRRSRSDAERLAFELSTMLTGADIAYLLHGDPEILERIRSVVRSRLS